MSMGLKPIFGVLTVMSVLFCSCSAVTVTVGNPGDVIEGSETRITCNIVREDSSSSTPIVTTWDKITNGGNERIASFILGQEVPGSGSYARFRVDAQAALIITNTLRTDIGIYECQAAVNGETPPDDKDNATLNVIYIEMPVLNFTTPVTENDMVELKCSVTAKPSPNYNFRKDGQVFYAGGETDNYRFSSVQRGDAGEYQCQVFNQAGDKTTDAQMLDVYYAPEIETSGNEEVSNGQTVVIESNVNANPPAKYEWTSDGPADTDSNDETYTFVAPDDVDQVYTVTLNATNAVASSQRSVKVTVVVSCGELSIMVIEPKVDKTNGEIDVKVGDEVVLDCECTGTINDGFEYEWMLDGETKTNEQLVFEAKEGHNVSCIATAGAPNPPQESLKVLVSKSDTIKDPEGGLSTGAIIGIVIGIIVVLIILAIVVIIVLKSRDDDPSNKSTDSAYMDVTWDTKDPNRVNQAKKTAPPSNGTKQESSKPDQYNKYANYGDDRAYNRTSYGDDYNDKPDDDDYANSMPVTV